MGNEVSSEAEAPAPTEPAPKEEDEPSMFGIDTSNEETLWWSPKFFALCFSDLKEMTWPMLRNVAQTTVISQIAFVVIFIFFIVFDAVSTFLVATFPDAVEQGALSGVALPLGRNGAGGAQGAEA